MNTTIQKILEDFDQFAPEYGKWKIDRNLAKSYIRSSIALVLEELGESVKAKEIDYIWENGDCSECGYSTYNDTGTPHKCEIADATLSEVSTLIHQWITELRG